MEVAEVDNEEMEELEASMDSSVENKILWVNEECRGLEGQRCSKVIFKNRQDVGWAARARRVMEVNGTGNEASRADSQK